MAKLIFGCGYLGTRVAQLWLDQGESVYALTRTPQRAEALAAIGIRPILGELGKIQPEIFPPELSTLLFAVGFDRQGGQTIQQVYVEGLRQTLAALSESPALAVTGLQRLIYISSTGVFGDAGGHEVDEDSPCEPKREGGKACLTAEQLLAEHPLGKRSLILRMAGIYGPGRIPRGADLKAGVPIDAPSEGSLNLIHVEDAARIVLLAEAKAVPPRTYLVSDGQPAMRGDYYRKLARLLSAPEPKFVAPTVGTPAAQRAASDKRISNARLVRELAPPFLYPSYVQGLAAIVQQSETDQTDQDR